MGTRTRYLVVVVSLAALVAERTDLGVVPLVVLHVVPVGLLQLERLVTVLADEHPLRVHHL